LHVQCVRRRITIKFSNHVSAWDKISARIFSWILIFLNFNKYVTILWELFKLSFEENFRQKTRIYFSENCSETEFQKLVEKYFKGNSRNRN
jgi:hypothetical protein